jgi:hypothetical protein
LPWSRRLLVAKDAGMEVRMKKLFTAAAIAVAALVVAAAGSAAAGPKGDKENMLQKAQDEANKRQTKDLDRAYNETVKRTGGATKPYDPWGSVRPADKK